VTSQIVFQEKKWKCMGQSAYKVTIFYFNLFPKVTTDLQDPQRNIYSKSSKITWSNSGQVWKYLGDSEVRVVILDFQRYSTSSRQQRDICGKIGHWTCSGSGEFENVYKIHICLLQWANKYSHIADAREINV